MLGLCTNPIQCPKMIELHSYFSANDAGPFNRIFVLEGRTSKRQTIGQITYFPLIFFTFGLLVGNKI